MADLFSHVVNCLVSGSAASENINTAMQLQLPLDNDNGFNIPHKKLLGKNTTATSIETTVREEYLDKEKKNEKSSGHEDQEAEALQGVAIMLNGQCYQDNPLFQEIVSVYFPKADHKETLEKLRKFEHRQQQRVVRIGEECMDSLIDNTGGIDRWRIAHRAERERVIETVWYSRFAIFCIS